MFCNKCGNKIDENSNICPSCGSSINQNTNVATPAKFNDTINKDNTSLTLSDTKYLLANKKIRTIIIIALLLIIAIVVGICFHINSDSYKINKASKLIVAGNYSEGLSKISDVYNSQSEIIKNFVKIENLKEDFVSSMDKDNLIQYNTNCSDAYYKFKNAVDCFEEENEVYYLTDELRAHYNCYKSAVDFASEYRTDLPSLFSSAQQVMLNEVYKNKSSKSGDKFTLNQLQERVDITKDSLQELESLDQSGDFDYIEINDSNIINSCKTFENDNSEDDIPEIYIDCGSSVFRASLSTLMNRCNSEMYSEQLFITENSEEHDMTQEVYKVSPDEGYSSTIGIGFVEIDSEEDISTNTNILMNSLRISIAYQLITGESF